MNSSFLLITNNKNEKIFEIKENGSVYWLKNKKFVKADTDEKLGKALGEALNQLVNINKILKNDKI